MLDPVSALGFATNVLNLVDFAAKVVLNAGEISNTGSVTEIKELDTVAKDLAIYIAKLEQGFTSENRILGCLTEEESSLEKLAADCKRVVAKIINIQTSVNNNSDGRRIKSTLPALRAAIAQRKLNPLKERLATIRGQIEFHIHHSLKTEIDVNNARQGERFDELNFMLKKISHNQNSTQQLVKQLESLASARHAELTTNIEDFRINQSPRLVYSSILPTTSTSRENEAQRLQAVSSNPARISCGKNCSCVCHRRYRITYPPTLRQIFGYTIMLLPGSVTRNSPCNEKLCMRNSSKMAQIIYYFPSWILARACVLTLVTHRHSPEISLKFLRIVPDSADIFHFAKVGDLEGIKSLFKDGHASPDDVNDSWGVPPLNFAVQGMHLDLCKFLLQNGANVTRANKSSVSALDIAWYYVLCKPSGSMSADEKLKQIFGLFTDSEWIEEQQFSTIHKIVLGLSNRNLVEELENSTSMIESFDAKGRSPLSWAAARGEDLHIQTLLRYKADPNIKSVNGYSCLMRAVRSCSPNSVAMLLKAGARVGSRSNQKFTELHIAAYYRDGSDYLEPLLEHGADIEAVDSYGWTPISCTTEYDHGASAAVLLRHGANMNAQCADGWTPLLRAINSNSHRVLRLLLDSGADHRIRSFKQESVLHFAARRADLETLELLINSNMSDLDVEARCTDGQSAREMLELRQVASSELVRSFGKLIASVNSASDGIASGALDTDDRGQEEDFTFFDALEF